MQSRWQCPECELKKNQCAKMGAGCSLAAASRRASKEEQLTEAAKPSEAPVMNPEECDVCHRTKANTVEEWDDALDLLCMGGADCRPPSKGLTPYELDEDVS